MEVNNKTVPVTGQQDQNTISLDLMNRMKLHGMAEAFRESLAGTTPQSMTADTFLSMLLAREWDYRSQAAIARLTKNAAFRYKAYIEQIDYATNRGLDRNQMERLATLDFVHKAQNLFITGSSGTGKSYLACALGHEACKRGFRTFYANAPKLLGALKVAKVKGMAEAFRESLAGTTPQSMTADTFLSMLLAREWDYRSQAAIARLTKNAAFRYKAYIEQIDYATNRGLDRNQMERLATLDFVHKAQNLFITGSSGTGKSYLACALGHEACKRGFRTFYANAPKLLGALKVAKVKGTLEAELKKIERCQLLILDDLFIVPLDAKERPILLEIIEDRHERKSVIITSQYPSSNWYDMVGDPTIADAILDRIIHTAHTIELYGESMRKLKSKKNENF